MHAVLYLRFFQDHEHFSLKFVVLQDISNFMQGFSIHVYTTWCDVKQYSSLLLCMLILDALSLKSIAEEAESC